MPEADYDTISARLKLLAHPERLRILDAVRRDSECVCHLEALLGKPQPYVSQQLRLLRDAGVILDEKQGQNVFYRLCDDAVRAWLDALLGAGGRRASGHGAAQAGDRLRLSEMQRRDSTGDKRRLAGEGVSHA
jgi:DNA-binding transcriptional ArsR family regulator